MRLTHIGGPTTLVELNGWTILTDPTFDPPGRRYTFGWGTSSRKTAGPALAVSELPAVDLILLSHDHHADNLDDAGRALLDTADTVLTTTPGARRLGLKNVRGLDNWESTTVEAAGRPALTVTATPCRHGPKFSRPIAGKVVGFALATEGYDSAELWVSGDTVLFDGVREVAGRLSVDVALLHLGGVQFGFTGPVKYSMTAHEAVELLETLRPRAVVPVHYEGWSHFAEPESTMRRVLDTSTVADRIRWLTPGEPTEV
jgi:L-ascorbate metabolism protein UlaG (beta-lactamase superfamily)